MQRLTQVLKNKVVALKDYSAEPLVTDELEELAAIINDTEAELDERILAARVMCNVSDNRLVRAKRQVLHWNAIHSALVHQSEKSKAEASLINSVVNKLGIDDDIVALLERLVEKVKK